MTFTSGIVAYTRNLKSEIQHSKAGRKHENYNCNLIKPYVYIYICVCVCVCVCVFCFLHHPTPATCMIISTPNGSKCLWHPTWFIFRCFSPWAILVKYCIKLLYQRAWGCYILNYITWYLYGYTRVRVFKLTCLSSTERTWEKCEYITKNRSLNIDRKILRPWSDNLLCFVFQSYGSNSISM